MRIKVNGNYYDYFNDVAIETSLAALASKFTFTAYYDPTNPVHRVLFKPLSFYPVQFFDDTRADETPNHGLLSTGTLIRRQFRSGPMPELSQISGYSTGGVLEDCQIPHEAYPLESDNKTFAQIATKLLGLFNIGLIIYPSAQKQCNLVITKSVCKVDETIKTYLSVIASQLNVIMSHDIHGNVIIFQPDTTAPSKLFLTAQNTLTMDFDENGQDLHSSVTTIRQPTKSADGNNPFTNPYDNLPDEFQVKSKSFKIASIDTVQNPMITAYRPYTDLLHRRTFYSTGTASQNMRAAELQHIKINFSLNYWPNVSVGDVIEIQNPAIYVNNRVRMILESTTIRENSKERTMSGTLVMPETFTGATPVNIFL